MGVVFNIQRFCLHDGPGLRTTVFLKGCPLRCRWCSNPESQRMPPELLYNRARCLRCASCAAACPDSIPTPAPEGEREGEGEGMRFSRAACAACGACADVCPTGAAEVKGRDMTAEETVREALRDGRIHASSGGGVTLSGGEPFLQPTFLMEVLTGLKAAGAATAVETTAHVEWPVVEAALPLLDCVLVDVKHVDSARHREWTGVGTETILPNVASLCAKHDNVLVRIPVVPGFNDDAEAAEGFAAFLTGVTKSVELLPYHVLGEGKYAMLDRAYPGAAIAGGEARPATDRLRKRLEAAGLAVIVDM